jgi:hypothetical protein
MKKFFFPLFATALLLAGTLPASAQKASDQSTETKRDTTTTTANGTVKGTVETVSGKIESYDAGKSLKVSVPGKIITSKSFSLDSKDYTYSVAPNLKPGEWVTVTDKTDSKGRKSLTVKHSKPQSAPAS